MLVNHPSQSARNDAVDASYAAKQGDAVCRCRCTGTLTLSYLAIRGGLLARLCNVTSFPIKQNEDYGQFDYSQMTSCGTGWPEVDVDRASFRRVWALSPVVLFTRQKGNMRGGSILEC
jgi:hypothetical protein